MNMDEIFRDAFPEAFSKSMDRSRPYTGQPHTDNGIRGATEIRGVTFRDLRDCFIRAAFLSAHPHPGYHEADKGEQARLSENDLYDLNWNELDPVAIAQNLSCEVERLMGIFPNVPKLAAEEILEEIPTYELDEGDQP